MSNWLQLVQAGQQRPGEEPALVRRMDSVSSLMCVHPHPQTTAFSLSLPTKSLLGSVALEKLFRFCVAQVIPPCKMANTMLTLFILCFGSAVSLVSSACGAGGEQPPPQLLAEREKLSQREKSSSRLTASVLPRAGPFAGFREAEGREISLGLVAV